MAKVAFSKLGLKPTEATKTISINNNQIEVRQYLPIADKIKFVEEVVNAVMGDAEVNGYHYVNWAQVSVLRTIGFIKYYTNISFTEKQSEDIYKLFDSFESTATYGVIYNIIPENERSYINELISVMIDTIYKYKTSALGIVESIGNDYKNVEFDTEKLRENIGDKDNLTLLREVLEKMG